MRKIKALNNKLLNNKKLIHVELTFNSNDDLNMLLGKNSENIDKLNEILNVEVSFFGNRLLIFGKKASLTSCSTI